MALHPLYKLAPDEDAESVLSELRRRISNGEKCAVVITGNRLVLQWAERGYVREVQAILTDVDDGMQGGL